MPRLLVAAAALGLAFLSAAPARAQDNAIDLAIVLAVDSSGSINTERFLMQVQGYASALTSKEVIDQITAGRHHRIAIAYFEWADEKRIAHVVPWTLIDSADSAAAVAGVLIQHRRQLVGDTCIGCAIDEAMKLFDALPYRPDRKVLDISGDGEANAGPPVEVERGLALSRDITINGLPIVTAYEPNLARYYETQVIGGPGSFMIQASGFEDFARAVSDKLLREVAGLDAHSSQLARLRGDAAP
jgi:hypothetical protein